MPTPVFDKIKNGAATIKDKTKKGLTNAVNTVKKGVDHAVEGVKTGVNSTIAKVNAPFSRGNKRLKKLRRRRKLGRFFPDETETEDKKKSWFRLARQCVSIYCARLKIISVETEPTNSRDLTWDMERFSGSPSFSRVSRTFSQIARDRFAEHKYS